MNEAQKKKRNFRQSKKWKDFRHQKNVEQKGIDPITKKKLCKGANLHHRNLNADEYENIENTDDFVMMNHQTHECLHWIYRYYKNDKDILNRIREELEKWHD